MAYYEVDEKPYRSVHVAFYSSGTNMKYRMETRMRALKAKGSMPVHYNPKNPYEISRGYGFLFALIPFGVGVLFIGCAWLVRKLGLRDMSSKPKPATRKRKRVQARPAS